MSLMGGSIPPNFLHMWINYKSDNHEPVLFKSPDDYMQMLWDYKQMYVNLYCL